jgi:anti-sigma factor RsiW
MTATPLTCQELVEIVTDYLENALPDDQQARFAAHLAICSKCCHYVEQMRITIQLTGRLSEASIQPERRADLLDAFRDWKQNGS